MTQIKVLGNTLYNDAGQVNQYEHQNSANYVYNDADDEVPIIDDSDIADADSEIDLQSNCASVEAELKLKSIAITDNTAIQRKPNSYREEAKEVEELLLNDQINADINLKIHEMKMKNFFKKGLFGTFFCIFLCNCCICLVLSF